MNILDCRHETLYSSDEADWFLKADDDTYVIMENLHSFLQPYSTSDPIYFGCKFKQQVKMGYMSGGAGYVLSKEALRRFIEYGLTEEAEGGAKCRTKDDRGHEDVEIGKCMASLKVSVIVY